MEIAPEVLEVIRTLAHKVANTYEVIPQGYDRCDFVQIATMAAIRKLQRVSFDPNRSSIETFLYRRMDGAIQDEIFRYTKYRIVKRAMKRLMNEGCEEYKQDIFLDHKVVRFSQIDRSLEHTADGVTAEDLFEDTKEGQPDNKLLSRDWLKLLVRMYPHLSRADKLLLILRFGECMSQVEAGKVLGLGGSAVSLMEKSIRKRTGIVFPKVVQHVMHRKERKEDGRESECSECY